VDQQNQHAINLPSFADDDTQHLLLLPIFRKQGNPPISQLWACCRRFFETKKLSLKKDDMEEEERRVYDSKMKEALFEKEAVVR